MKIYDAVYTAAVLLQLDELCDDLKADGFDITAPNNSLREDSARDLDILLRCCNLILGEWSQGDFPLKTTAVLCAKQGKIAYADFDRKVTDISAVEQNGKRLPVQMYYDGITVPAEGMCTVTYTFAPPTVALDDVSPYAGDRPSVRLAAYGIAREYCLISGMTENAAVWDNRYVACLQDEANTKRAMTVRPRIWR